MMGLTLNNVSKQQVLAWMWLNSKSQNVMNLNWMTFNQGLLIGS
jgi:hypothetical protein